MEQHRCPEFPGHINMKPVPLRASSLDWDKCKTENLSLTTRRWMGIIDNFMCDLFQTIMLYLFRKFQLKISSGNILVLLKIVQSVLLQLLWTHELALLQSGLDAFYIGYGHQSRHYVHHHLGNFYDFSPVLLLKSPKLCMLCSDNSA